MPAPWRSRPLALTLTRTLTRTLRPNPPQPLPEPDPDPHPHPHPHPSPRPSPVPFTLTLTPTLTRTLAVTRWSPRARSTRRATRSTASVDRARGPEPQAPLARAHRQGDGRHRRGRRHVHRHGADRRPGAHRLHEMPALPHRLSARELPSSAMLSALRHAHARALALRPQAAEHVRLSRSATGRCSRTGARAR